MSNVTVTCPCGQVFTTPDRRIRAGKGKYCSRACGFKYRPHPSHRNGAPVPPKQQRVCRVCERAFEVTASRVIHNGAGVYCSRECQIEGQRGSLPAGFTSEDGKPRATKHGLYQTPEYRSWKAMRGRCLNPNNAAWEHYGGRGITICPEWDDFEVFLRDMGPRPEGLTLDRINVDGNYEPSNCRWLPLPDQSRNRRPSSQWKKPPRRPPADCGTTAGYYRHRRNSEPACDPCRAAIAEDSRARRQERKAS